MSEQNLLSLISEIEKILDTNDLSEEDNDLSQITNKVQIIPSLLHQKNNFSNDDKQLIHDKLQNILKQIEKLQIIINDKKNKISDEIQKVRSNKKAMSSYKNNY